MKFQFSLVIACSCFVMASCSVSKSKSSTIKTIDIDLTGIVQKPVIVDLDVKENKVSGVATENTEAVNINIVKQEAIADAVKKANADILVEPMFTTETVGSKITVTVTGFPANYKNFRPIKQEDIPLLNTGRVKKASIYEPSSSESLPVKNNNKSVVVGVLAAAIVALGLALFL